MKQVALVAALLCSFLNMSYGQNSVSAMSPGVLVEKDSANRMIQSYLGSISGSYDSTDSPPLNSLIMDAASLRAYLSDTSITSIKVMFAHTLAYINNGQEGQPAGYKSGALTIVLAGFDQQGNYVYANDDMVLNHAVPCPTNCPNTGTASSNLLQ